MEPSRPSRPPLQPAIFDWYDIKCNSCGRKYGIGIKPGSPQPVACSIPDCKSPNIEVTKQKPLDTRLDMRLEEMLKKL